MPQKCDPPKLAYSHLSICFYVWSTLFCYYYYPKSQALSLLHPGVWKLNIAFKSQFPRWDYANQPLPVSPFCFLSSLIHPPPPWCISSFAVVYSIHLKTSFFTLNSPTHVFPLCIVTLPLANLCACVCVCAYTNLLSMAFWLKNNHKKNPPNPKSYYSSEI